MLNPSEGSPARKVHNGLIGIIGWIQFLQRRVRARRVDWDDVDAALIRLHTLSSATEQTFVELHNRLQYGDDPEHVTDVASAVIAEVGYGRHVPVLTIQFQSGRTYEYFDVPDDVYRGLMATASKGRYFNRHIRDRYAFRRA